MLKSNKEGLNPGLMCLLANQSLLLRTNRKASSAGVVGQDSRIRESASRRAIKKGECLVIGY